MCSSGEREGAQPGQDNPHLQYFPIAARGEIIRMTAALGGVEMSSSYEATDDEKMACGSPGSLPILTHGDVKLSQSFAVEAYISSISPRYAGLTAHARAKDMQYSGIKDDLMMGLVKLLFADGDKDTEAMKNECNKWWTVLENMAPMEGFVNGLEFPTPADFVMVLVVDGWTPYKGGYTVCGFDPKEYPKAYALYERIKAHPEVAAYCGGSETMAGNPFGIGA